VVVTVFCARVLRTREVAHTEQHLGADDRDFTEPSARDVDHRDAAVVALEELQVQVREHGLGRNGLQHALAVLQRMLCPLERVWACMVWTSERDRFGMTASSSSAAIERAMCWGALSLRMTVRCMLGLPERKCERERARKRGERE